jgi:cytochrome c peroxidase
MKIKASAVVIISFVLLASFVAQEYRLAYPGYFPPMHYDFSKNSLDSSTVALGRNLFYDPVLSADNSISCASCHSPYNAFAHTDHALSHGIYDQIGRRNAPALFNLAWQNLFMWDGASNHLDVQALAPISHPKEMGETISSVVKKLNASSFYRTLFYNVYNDSTATGEKVLKALAQFQLTLISCNSRYDLVRLKKDSFTKQESNGYALFLKNCNTCHTEPLFSNYKFANNGLEVDTTLSDYGRWMVTKKPEDSLLFKIPSLRNLSFSYPYMHDGRFKKLSEVVNHYTNGIKQHKTLSKELKKIILLTSNEKIDLIAFLLTLNDKEFVFDSKHQFPKKNN